MHQKSSKVKVKVTRPQNITRYALHAFRVTHYIFGPPTHNFGPIGLKISQNVQNTMMNEICFVFRDILIFKKFDFSKFLKKKFDGPGGGPLKFFFAFFSFYQLKKYQNWEVAKIWLISLKNVEKNKTVRGRATSWVLWVGELKCFAKPPKRFAKPTKCFSKASKYSAKAQKCFGEELRQYWWLTLFVTKWVIGWADPTKN